MIANHADLIARLRADYLRGDLHVSDLHLMRESADALALCDKAMETGRERELDLAMRVAQLSAWLAEAEFALATERARCAKLVDDAIEEIRPLIPATTGATEPSTSTASGPGSIATCEDCPPVGYPTDKTRCAVCPYRAPPYGEWCRNPKACAGKGYCPLDPTCGGS